MQALGPAGPPCRTFFPLYPASHDGIGNRVALAEHEPDEKKASDSGHDVGTSLHPPAAQELPDVGYMRRLSAEPILSLDPEVVLVTADAGPTSALEHFRTAGAEGRFEEVWANRETHLAEVPGFVAFKLLRGPDHEDHTLFVSHTLWASKEAFDAWTRSDAFRQAHASAGANKDMYLGPPQFEGFQVVQSET